MCTYTFFETNTLNNYISSVIFGFQKSNFILTYFKRDK